MGREGSGNGIGEEQGGRSCVTVTGVGECRMDKVSSRLTLQGDAADGESWQNPDGPASLIGKSSHSRDASPVSPKRFSDEDLEAFLDRNA
jgi:hypothetical protein